MFSIVVELILYYLPNFLTVIKETIRFSEHLLLSIFTKGPELLNFHKVYKSALIGTN